MPASHNTKRIRAEWEGYAPGDESGEFLGLASDGNKLYAIGIQKPSPGRSRAGSYTASDIESGKLNISGSDQELAASGLVAVPSGLIVMGYLPSDGRSKAAFRLADPRGKQLWTFVSSGNAWRFPLTALATPKGYLLIALETNLSSSQQAAVILSAVSVTGSLIADRRYEIPLTRLSAFGSQNVTIDSAGKLVIAIGGETSANSNSPALWINPQTGSKRICIGHPATALLRVDPGTLALTDLKLITDVTIRGMRSHDKHTFAVLNRRNNCRLSTSIELVKVYADLTLEPLFKSNGANSIEAHDIETTPDGFVIVGTTHTFLPSELAQKTEDFQAILHRDPWADDIWEKNEESAGAFVLALTRKGEIVDDLVFPDMRFRGFSRVVARPGPHFIGVGGALGDHGWAAGFSLNWPKQDQ
jgi:hypothetical protein